VFCVVSQNKVFFPPYMILSDWFLKPRQKAFTARYDLNFKGFSTLELDVQG